MADTPTSTLVCPKCQGLMRSYERNGVVIDQCQECRGVFLDRGELERIMDAEEQRYPPPAASRSRGRDEPYFRRDDDDDDDDDHRRYPRHGKPGRKRGGLFGELFD